MLSGFACDEDQTGWLAGVALWAAGAMAGCLLAIASAAPGLSHWQVLALAAIVSLLSLGLRLPVLLTQCSVPLWLTHSVWMLGLFAQANWAGFLAARSTDGTTATEALLICFAMEGWLLLLFIKETKLPWLQQLFRGSTSEVALLSVELPEVARSLPTLAAGVPVPADAQLKEASGNFNGIHRTFVDGMDEYGERYVSGSVRLEFEPEQRSVVFVLSFCPAFVSPAEIELECDSEDISAKVEHATETGARIAVRRESIGEATTSTIEWFAKAATANSRHSSNLP